MRNVLPTMRDWLREHGEHAALGESRPANPVQRKKPVRTPCTDDERAALLTLAMPHMTYPVASFHKRFARNMGDASEMTDNQRSVLWRMVWRYRRQIANKGLVAMAGQKIGKG